MNRLMLAFFGDDLTGSTDALEQLALTGARGALFLQAPSKEDLSRFDDLQAVGIAGTTRALSPQSLETELRPALAALRAFRTPYVHYKTCSTFDSSPEIGNIGRAMELGREICQPALTPILGGNPLLGRYCAFGNLFATANTTSAGQAYRLDRHPSASLHAATPMRESDLRCHLNRQTDSKIGLFDLRCFNLPLAEQRERLCMILEEGADAVLFDALDVDHLRLFADLTTPYASPERPVFVVGSSAVETSLGRHWQSEGAASPSATWPQAVETQILVASASCSPVTAAQIDQAVVRGFKEIALDTTLLVGESIGAERSLQQAVDDATRHLQKGRSVVVHTAKGPRDARVEAVKSLFPSQLPFVPQLETGCAETLGRALGRLIDRCLKQTEVTRVCVTGGDASSFAARELGIRALQMLRPAESGAPLCRAWAPGRAADAVEFNFKGGQVGAYDYFETLRCGSCETNAHSRRPRELI